MKEIELKIKKAGEPVLRNGVKQVKEVTDYHRKKLSEMARLMYEVFGVGLASVQVGLDEAMITVDAGSGLYKLINPKIVKQSGSQASVEGCLSVPGESRKIKRAKFVVVQALDEDGKPIKIEADGILACVFQHELDHLNGKLIIDHENLA